jgi:hypothetical protein
MHPWVICQELKCVSDCVRGVLKLTSCVPLLAPDELSHDVSCGSDKSVSFAHCASQSPNWGVRHVHVLGAPVLVLPAHVLQKQS